MCFHLVKTILDYIIFLASLVFLFSVKVCVVYQHLLRQIAAAQDSLWRFVWCANISYSRGRLPIAACGGLCGVPTLAAAEGGWPFRLVEVCGVYQH